MPNGQQCSDEVGARRSTWLHALGLVAVGSFAFFYQLHVSLLEGSEGLYAHIAHEMVESGQFVRLTYLGEPYLNKPPLFFWLLALSTHLFGQNEVALRLPTVLFSIGTMALAYQFGKLLFSRTAGFWAALVVATSHVLLWYGRRVLFDAGLTFAITLALYAWMRASFKYGNPRWYLVSFLAMAFGAMLKALHAFALPLLLVGLYAAILKDSRPFKAPAFWIGLFLFGIGTGFYYLMLGKDFSAHFLIGENLYRLFHPQGIGAYTGDRPIGWYLGIMWFDFFPWSVLIPCGLVLLFSSRPLRQHPAELFVLLWVLVFFLAFSIAQGKREPYLMPIVPGLGLMVGYLYEKFSTANVPQPTERLLKLMLALLAVAFVASLLYGPSLLVKRWGVSIGAFPAWYMLIILALSSLLVHFLATAQVRLALKSFGALAVAFMVWEVALAIPAIDEAVSARRISDEVKHFAARSQVPVFQFVPKWPSSEDVVYYLHLAPKVPLLANEEALLQTLRQAGQAVALLEKQHFNAFLERNDLAVQQLHEFQLPRQNNYCLVGLRLRS